ncbi:LysR family transcriptional regulator [Nocardioides sp. Kera G14]|uniref:LysR family transcriptional regulator n=1 Tax=Nocardioides sp. Kera G14 TaxID=2884264 RepID=UPI001D0FA53E|nr:LysR family transcriptional regulator [Nocardioides sp. Kera G14]UDY24847.1 LysR family transcriptional regulator [Nocardioides sp. Kera G14]
MLLPDLSSLRLLADVARLGSIGAAARAFGISQQSASERLRAMEVQTGIVLLRRASQGSTLTEQGRLLVDWSAELLAVADEIEQSLQTLRQERAEELHVAASMTTAEFLLPGWLVRLRRQREVSISLQATNTDGVLAAVRSGDAGIGFIEGPARLDGLAHTDLGSDELTLVVSPDDPWARRSRPLSPAVIAARPLTSREPGSGTRAVLESALSTAGHTPVPPEVELTTNAAVAAAVRSGGAPGFLSRRAVERDLDVGSLVEVRATGLDLTRRFTAVWLGAPRPPAGPIRDLLAIALPRPGYGGARHVAQQPPP